MSVSKAESMVHEYGKKVCQNQKYGGRAWSKSMSKSESMVEEYGKKVCQNQKYGTARHVGVIQGC